MSPPRIIVGTALATASFQGLWSVEVRHNGVPTRGECPLVLIRPLPVRITHARRNCHEAYWRDMPGIHTHAILRPTEPHAKCTRSARDAACDERICKPVQTLRFWSLGGRSELSRHIYGGPRVHLRPFAPSPSILLVERRVRPNDICSPRFGCMTFRFVHTEPSWRVARRLARTKFYIRLDLSGLLALHQKMDPARRDDPLRGCPDNWHNKTY